MDSQCAKVGETAGRIYQILEKKGELKLENLTKVSGINNSTLFNQAIGWLCREDKLHLEKREFGTFVSLATASADNCC